MTAAFAPHCCFNATINAQFGVRLCIYCIKNFSGVKITICFLYAVLSIMITPVAKRPRTVSRRVDAPAGTSCKCSPFEFIFHVDLGMLYADLASYLVREDLAALSCVNRTVPTRLLACGLRLKPRSRLILHESQARCQSVFNLPDGRLGLIISNATEANVKKIVRLDVGKGSGGKVDRSEQNAATLNNRTEKTAMMTFPCGKIGYFRQQYRRLYGGRITYDTWLITSTDGGSTWAEQEVPVLSSINGFASVVLRDGSILVTGGRHTSVLHHMLFYDTDDDVLPDETSHVFRSRDGGVHWETLPTMEEGLQISRPKESIQGHSMVVMDPRPDDGISAQKYGVVVVVGGRHVNLVNHVLYSYDGGMSWQQGPRLPYPIGCDKSDFNQSYWSRAVIEYDYFNPVLVGAGDTFFMYGGTRLEDVKHAIAPEPVECTKARELWMTRDRGLTWELVCPLAFLDKGSLRSCLNTNCVESIYSMSAVCNGVFKNVCGQKKLFLTFTGDVHGTIHTYVYEVNL